MFVPYGDAAALQAAVGPQSAAVFLEPCQGEAGVVPAPAGYLRAAREACDAAGALLVIDEIQSGIGRTGAWFAHQAEPVVPDVLTLAKGLGGGLPIGACVGLGAAGTALGKGDHGSTFGGNPVACAAALAVLDTIESAGLLAHAAAVGERLAAGLAGTGHPMLRGVRGRGLWLAALLTAPVAGAVEAACRDAGFLVNAVQPDAIRLAPPLILSDTQAGAFVAALPAILDEADAAVSTRGDDPPEPPGGPKAPVTSSPGPWPSTRGDDPPEPPGGPKAPVTSSPGPWPSTRGATPGPAGHPVGQEA
jgi:acetylornithine aminotransferase